MALFWFTVLLCPCFHCFKIIKIELRNLGAVGYNVVTTVATVCFLESGSRFGEEAMPKEWE